MYCESLAGLPAHTNGDATRPPRAALGFLSGGPAGTIQTLKHMKAFVKDALRDPAQKVRTTANDIFRAAGISPRDWNGEIRALQAFVRDRIRYVKDPVDLELVQTPDVTLRLGYGDCDDKATLLGAMLQATGHPSKLTVIGLNGGPFSHVLVETKTGSNWIPLETILPGKEPGWFPSGVTSRYSLKLGN